MTTDQTITTTKNQYAISFRCPNCGHVFGKALQKGMKAEGMGGICPYCGIKDGQPGTGAFEVIRQTPSAQDCASYQGTQRPPFPQ